MNKSTILRNAHQYARELRLLEPSLHYSLALSAGMKQAWAESRNKSSDVITYTFSAFAYSDIISFPEKTVTTQRRFLSWFDYELHGVDLFWSVLGLDGDIATERDINRAYRRLAFNAHSDRGGCDVAMEQLSWIKQAALNSISFNWGE
ncbi:hypothetical protein BCU39_008335 [Vibrio cyclitrophicus]|uniref:J domain-containing protein n=1 Tax=Vibrio cyclitrophicus TaxID=47951 RepID=UPI000C82B2F4|nr:J domain-containing protein [Vibrio cyclitrophicus]PMI70287.1 hypothetical protein BCU39_04995 [Vibrio cyclitrophicus]